MLLENPPTLYTLEPPGKRGWDFAVTQKGNRVKSKHTKKSPRSGLPKPGHAQIFASSWARWRRKWLGGMAKAWDSVLTPDDKTWWADQALLVDWTNHKGIFTKQTRYPWYMSYQSRCLDLHIDKYSPFPSGAADFPSKYIEPWAPPTLEAPTVVSASVSGLVVIRCLNVTPNDDPCEPVCWFKLRPPILGTWPIGYHPWFWTSKVDDGDYSEYTYDLTVPFPFFRTCTNALLVHCYGVPSPIPAAYDGPFLPALGDDAGGPHPWWAPQYIQIYDSNYANVYTESGIIVSNYLRGRNFPFDIPADAKIQGIRLRIYPYTSNLTVFDNEVRLLRAGVPASQNKAIPGAWPRLTTYPHVYGSSTDLWDEEWTPDDINDPGFGAVLSVTIGPTYTSASVNCFQLTVWYKLGSPQFTIPSQHPFSFT